MSSLLTLPPFDAAVVLSGFSLVVVLTLLALLIGKDTLLMLLGRRSSLLHRALNVAVAPLVLVFFLIITLYLAQTLG
jgi:hypothetical protein